jgi:hypothetical protein
MSIAAAGVGAVLLICIGVVLVLIFRSREGREDTHGFGPVPAEPRAKPAEAVDPPKPSSVAK